MTKPAPVTRLGDVCAIESRLVDPRERSFADLTHVGGANIESMTGRLTGLMTASEEGLKSGKFLFGEDAVLYSKIRPYLMKVARPDFSGLCSADVYPLSPDGAGLDRDYLFYLLLSPDFTDYAIAGSARAGMPKVNRDHLFNYEFELPSLAEQRRIADELEEAFASIATARENAERNLRNARALFASHSDSVFASTDGRWVEVRLGDVVQTQYGLSTPMNTDEKGYRIFRMGDLQNGRLVDGGRMKYADISPDGFKKYRLRLGDVLFNRTNSYEVVGKTGLFDLPGDYCFASYLVRVLPDPQILRSQFLNYLMNSGRFQSSLRSKAARSVGQTNINATVLREERIRFPESLQEQGAVVERLDAVRESVRRLESICARKLVSLDELGQSLLQRAISGELATSLA